MPLQREVDEPKFEKELGWKQKLAEVALLKDGKDMGVEAGIQESVAAFQVHGFTTRQSCEGHVAEEGQKQRGLAYPWIEVHVPAPKGYREAAREQRKELDEQAKGENLQQWRKILELLQEFYEGRATAFDARLIAEERGTVEGFRVQALGAHVTAILTFEEKKQKLELYRKEMEDFTAFLKDKYFLTEEKSV